MEPTYSASAPLTVTHPVMRHSWQQLTFLHWAYDIQDVQRLLPNGLTVHTYEDKAWVGLVPFRIIVALPHLPSVPWVSRFPETNVRTYVKDTTGRTGIWFFSLDADRLGAVVTARVTYRLPYFWNAMTIDVLRDEVHYKSARKWPAPTDAMTDVRIRIGDAIAPEEVTSFENYLTARWTLFSAHKRGLHYANAHHEPWPLFRAEALNLQQTVLEEAGLPSPDGEPLVHFSPNVDVDIGLPHRVK